MVERKISNLNDDFDFRLFLKVVRKNIAWIFLFFVIAFSMAFLYLRYTYPIFESKSIIQIALSDKNSRMLLGDNFSAQRDISGKIELLKSSTFLDRVFNKLPLDISYYQIGNVLNYEMYRTSPFEIEYRNPISELYNVPVYVTFADENNVTLKTNLNNKETVFRLRTNTWKRLPIIDSINVKVRNFDKIRADLRGLNDAPYYFVLTNRENLVRTYSSNLKVEKENESAGTIKVLYYEKNPAKASDICNTIAEEFKIYDIEKQAESANNTIKFIDEQLKAVYDKLYDSEVELQNFKTANKLNDETPLPDFSTRINDLEGRLNQLQLDEAALKTVEQSLNNDKDLDVYQMVSILSGTEIKGNLQELLDDLKDMLQRRATALYSTTKNSSRIAMLDYQIEMQKTHHHGIAERPQAQCVRPKTRGGGAHPKL